ncbi:protein of unknown function [Burkholderia multivorans]
MAWLRAKIQVHHGLQGNAGPIVGVRPEAVIYGGQLWSKRADGCLDAAALSLALHS